MEKMTLYSGNTHIDKDTHAHTSVDCNATKSRHPSLSCKTGKKV